MQLRHSPAHITNPNVEQDTSLDGSGPDSGETAVKCRSRIVPDVPGKRQVPPVDHRRLATPVEEAVRLLLNEMETVMFTQTLRP